MNDSAKSLPTCDPRERLLEAAKLVEDAAYDLASSQSSGLVSELIVIAAEMDRIAKVIARADRLQDEGVKT